jgi:hypothetical protein
MDTESNNSNTTPDTEFSPPSSPLHKAELLNNARLIARHQVGSLTLEEKVSLLTAADFWRTKAIPEKGIPAIKTTDGPNGARGGIFVGGTKVRWPTSSLQPPDAYTFARLLFSPVVYPWPRHGTKTSSTR